MALKLKTVELAGTVYAETSDGHPVYVDDDGAETAFDANALLAKYDGLDPATLKRDREAVDALGKEAIAARFSGSKYLAASVKAPADLIHSYLKDRFAIRDGRVVGLDAEGSPIYSYSRPGEIADFEEALERIIDKDPGRDELLKTPAGSSDGGAGDGGKRQVTMAEFRRLHPIEQRKIALAAGRGELELVDGPDDARTPSQPPASEAGKRRVTMAEFKQLHPVEQRKIALAAGRGELALVD